MIDRRRNGVYNKDMRKEKKKRRKEMVTNQEKYIYNSLARIQAYIAGMCIGANLNGLGGKEWHYDSAEKGREIIEKEIYKLVKYLKRNTPNSQ